MKEMNEGIWWMNFINLNRTKKPLASALNGVGRELREEMEGVI
jgi:hypothetical protein